MKTFIYLPANHYVWNSSVHYFGTRIPQPKLLNYSRMEPRVESPPRSYSPPSSSNDTAGNRIFLPSPGNQPKPAELPPDTSQQAKATLTILSQRGTESLKEMVTCPICLDRLHRPKMLPCQHAFCFLCLQNSIMSADATIIRCAKCRAEIPLPKEGVSGFPSSIHLQNILDLLESDYASMDELLQCSLCQTVGSAIFCEHCNLSYCSLCLERHMEELTKQLNQIVQQLESFTKKVEQKYESFEETYSSLKDAIKLETERRVKKIKESESQLLKHLEEALMNEETAYKDVLGKVENAVQSTHDLADKSFDHIPDPNEKIRTFMKIHREAGDVLNEGSSIGLTRIVFDRDSFSLSVESRADSAEEDGEDSQPLSAPTTPTTQQPPDLLRQTADAQSRLYRSKSFHLKTRLGIGLVQRPSGVAVSPWSNEIFVVSMDNHKVLAFDSHTGRFLRSFGSRGQRSGEFLCPFGIALSPSDQEILITDKWKHCIHVFDKDGNFLRQIGIKGRSAGHFRSPESICVDQNGRVYVCDTCNHRIQVLDRDGIFLHEIGVKSSPDGAFTRTRSMFQEPTGIAVSPDGQKVVVCDFGSHRIHVFSSEGDHLFTFGQKGTLKGQFIHPECVSVDSRGFIFIGDSGNGRVQICRPDGRHVRSFGNKGSNNGQFSWISGIAVTPNHEIVVSDFKNHSVQVF